MSRAPTFYPPAASRRIFRTLQADAYTGLNTVYKPDPKPGPITEAGCWAHARREFFELADIASKARRKTSRVISPIAFEAVSEDRRHFMLERSIGCSSPDERVAVRRKDIEPPVSGLIDWMTRERAKRSKAMDHMLKRIDAFTRFLQDGRICLSNNAAARELRGITLGRNCGFLREVCPGGASDLGRISQADVTHYIERHAGDWSANSGNAMVGALRSFLRYLYHKGLNAPALPAVCPPSGDGSSRARQPISLRYKFGQSSTVVTEQPLWVGGTTPFS